MGLRLPWMGENERLAQLDERVKEEHRARFGSEELSEAEKARRVRRHFDAVAGKYDLMNTLLSFGAHYWWKHRAVRMLGLNPGGRVLDVSGGTGDLSILSQRAVGPRGQVLLYDINKPRELRRQGEEYRLRVEDLTGLGYNPSTARYFLTTDTRVNYMAHFKRIH